MLNRSLRRAIAATIAVVAGRRARQAQKSPRGNHPHRHHRPHRSSSQPWLVAIQNGFFADEGLQRQTCVHPQRRGQAEGLMKGDLHFALSSTEGILQNAERGGPAAHAGRRIPDGCRTYRHPEEVPEGRGLKGATVGILTLTEGSFFNWQEIRSSTGLKYPNDYPRS